MVQITGCGADLKPLEMVEEPKHPFLISVASRVVAGIKDST